MQTFHYCPFLQQSSYFRDTLGNNSALELSIEAGEARELEHREERLGVELGTPVPRRGQPTVDATEHIK